MAQPDIVFVCNSSDIDLIVHSKDGRSWKPEELEALMLVLREAFCRLRICTQEGIQIINGATVPIIKLTDRKTDVKVDMSFNMNNGLRSAQLILVCIRRTEVRRFCFRKGL
jgi:non-canonical poly(A) RNA polymerase PAPD5/7